MTRRRLLCFFVTLAVLVSSFESYGRTSGDNRGVVLVVGGGASGVSAGLQAARMGVETVIVEETPWLGGMLTAAGVTATDGCYDIRGGIWGEFADSLASRYGGYDALKTGWVSNILYEPHVGEQIFENMCRRESLLTVVKQTRFQGLTKKPDGWTVRFTDENGAAVTYDCDIVIDCTELGDVAKAAGVKYRIGMDSPALTGESAALGPNDVVQDITMVMTLKDYGHDVTIACPDGYDESQYVDCCRNPYNVPCPTGQTLWEPSMMMSYGKCPGGKYMINWPIYGNDFYSNMIEMSREDREEQIRLAKLHSLGFLYFMQTRLGYNTLGLADDEYPTPDLLPFYPYHRESRRIEGEYMFTVDEAASTFVDDAYRTGVAVGDYPVDHHHYQYPDWRSVAVSLPKIVPFSVPLGCMVPLGVEDLIVAEKSISVSNLVNGSTRLQPVVIELGQAAGAMAAIALKHRNVKHDMDSFALQSSGAGDGSVDCNLCDCRSQVTGLVDGVSRYGDIFDGRHHLTCLGGGGLFDGDMCDEKSLKTSSGVGVYIEGDLYDIGSPEVGKGEVSYYVDHMCGDGSLGVDTEDGRVRGVNVREVQQALLSAGALCMPYRDCLSDDADFEAIQHVGLTGIMRGESRTVGWSNECRFRVDDPLRWSDLYLTDYYGVPYNSSDSLVTPAEFLSLLGSLSGSGAACSYASCSGDHGSSAYCLGDHGSSAYCSGDHGSSGGHSGLNCSGEHGLNCSTYKFRQQGTTDIFRQHGTTDGFIANFSSGDTITRRQAAVYIDRYLRPFRRAVDWSGHICPPPTSF